MYLHPWQRRQALGDVLGELFGREVAVLEESACLNLDVTNRTKLLDECTERMKRADRLYRKR
jgi:hypothetical protein